MKTIAISIDEAILDALDRIATREGNRSRLVRAALREYIERRARTEREERERRIFSENADRLREELQALVEEQAEP